MGSQTEDTSRIKNGPIVKTLLEWNGLTKGDECYIVGDRDGVYQFQEWFIYESGVECVQLYGGPPGHRKTRFVGADVVSTERRRSASPQESPEPAGPTSPVGDYRARREELKLSRSALADIVGTTHAAVASVEAGRSARDKDAPAKMAAYLWPKAHDEQGDTYEYAGLPDSIIEDDEDEEDEW